MTGLAVGSKRSEPPAAVDGRCDRHSLRHDHVLVAVSAARNAGRCAVPAAARRDGTRRSTETTKTPSWTRSTPLARTTQRTGRAARRHQRRRRRYSHAAMSWTPRGGGRRTFGSWFRSRTRYRWARSRRCRCRLVPCRAASGAAATPLPRVVRGLAGPRPQSARRPGCGRPGAPSGERRSAGQA
jgi:hypothetical protein